MRFNEILNEYYDAENDSMSKTRLDDTRRPRLTLRHLNKLRKMRALEKLEYDLRLQDLGDIYGKGEL